MHMRRKNWAIPELTACSYYIPQPEALRGRVQHGMLQLFEHRDGMEGFFIARMRRKVR